MLLRRWLQRAGTTGSIGRWVAREGRRLNVRSAEPVPESEVCEWLFTARYAFPIGMDQKEQAALERAVDEGIPETLGDLATLIWDIEIGSALVPYYTGTRTESYMAIFELYSKERDGCLEIVRQEVRRLSRRRGDRPSRTAPSAVHGDKAVGCASGLDTRRSRNPKVRAALGLALLTIGAGLTVVGAFKAIQLQSEFNVSADGQAYNVDGERLGRDGLPEGWGTTRRAICRILPQWTCSSTGWLSTSYFLGGIGIGALGLGCRGVASTSPPRRRTTEPS